MDREVKNAKIKETYALTRERRMSQVPLTFRMKVRNEKRNKRVGVFDAWTNINEILKEPINTIGSKTDFKNGRRTVDAKETSPTEFTEIRYDFKPSDFDAPNVHITGWRLNLRYFTKEFFKSMFNLGNFAEISKRMYGNLSDTATIYISANEDSFDEDDIIAIRKKFPDDDFIIFSDDIE